MCTRRVTQCQIILLLLIVSACTSRTKEVLKQNYIITDILVQRVEDSACTDKPTRQNLEDFVQSTKRTFESLKTKGVAISEIVYIKATTLNERIANKDPSLTDFELIQFLKMTRDVYKMLTEEKKNGQ